MKNISSKIVMNHIDKLIYLIKHNVIKFDNCPRLKCHIDKKALYIYPYLEKLTEKEKLCEDIKSLYGYIVDNYIPSYVNDILNNILQYRPESHIYDEYINGDGNIVEISYQYDVNLYISSTCISSYVIPIDYILNTANYYGLSNKLDTYIFDNLNLIVCPKCKESKYVLDKEVDYIDYEEMYNKEYRYYCDNYSNEFNS